MQRALHSRFCYINKIDKKNIETKKPNIVNQTKNEAKSENKEQAFKIKKTDKNF